MTGWLSFPAFEEVAAYVDGGVPRGRAVTLGRDEDSRLRDDFTRRELRVVRVWMRSVEGEEAEEFFDGEFDSGWVEVGGPLNAAQRANLTPMWKVEPR